jgi:hypothetical protein
MNRARVLLGIQIVFLLSLILMQGAVEVIDRPISFEGNSVAVNLLITEKPFHFGIIHSNIISLDEYTTSQENDTTSPEVESSFTVWALAGIHGYSVTWHPTDLYPDNYTIYRNGTIIDSGDWDGSEISISLDGVPIGIYNYTLVVCDTSNNDAKSQVTVYILEAVTTDTSAATDVLPDLTILFLAVPVSIILLIATTIYIKQRKLYRELNRQDNH